MMKRNFTLISLMIIISIIINSCTPDNTSPNSTDLRDKITDTWNVSETTGPYCPPPQSFQVDIAKDPNNSNRIILDNFFGLGYGKDVYAIMSNLQLTIPTQTLNITQNDTWIFSGSGTIASNYKTITLNYTADDGNGPKSVVDNFSLQ
jgi:hypothetical protein